MGTLQRSDGSVRYIASGKIRNALNPEENIVSLHQRLLVASNSEWAYALMENGSLTIWPHLSASGWRNALPKSNEDFRGLTKLNSLVLMILISDIQRINMTERKSEDGL